MKLHDLSAVFDRLHFPALGELAHPERDSVLAARTVVGTAISDDEFLTDCFAWEVDRLADDRLLTGLVPFFVHPVLGVRFSFGYWPPGGTPGPHEHTAWTITG